MSEPATANRSALLASEPELNGVRVSVTEDAPTLDAEIDARANSLSVRVAPVALCTTLWNGGTRELSLR